MEAASAFGDIGIHCVRHLLLIGADASVTDSNSLNAMHLAARHNNKQVIAELYSHHPFLIDSRTVDGETPLMLAVTLNNVQSVQMLIQLGTDLGICNRAGKTAADLAFSHRCRDSQCAIAAAIR